MRALERFYGPASVSLKPEAPGEYPFTRGIHPTMYQGKVWTMRQYAGYGSASQTNERFRYLLSEGQTGLSLAFDLPTQIGLDSDDPRALGEVGRAGVAISSVEEMKQVFKGIPLDKVTVSMTINATAAILLGMLIVAAREQGVNIEDVGGTTQNDILKEYIARGTYIFPPEPSMRLAVDLIEFTSRKMPRWNPISISGYHMREAGATAAQEVAFTLANGIAYVQAASARGLSVDSFAPKLSFFFGCHSNFLEEIAKFRAARSLWAKIMKERFMATNPKSWMLRFHTQTDGVTLTAQQPFNNVIRATLQALAAALGGTQSLHTNAYDEALALPTESSALLALRTQQIIACESSVTNVADPVGGAYAVEALARQILEEAEGMIQSIDEKGSSLAAISYIQSEIQRSAYEDARGVESGERIVVGVNRFQEEESRQPSAVSRQQLRKRQIQSLRRLRKNRDGVECGKRLRALEDAARGEANLMPLILACVESRATVGEISDTLRKVFGEHKENVVL